MFSCLPSYNEHSHIVLLWFQFWLVLKFVPSHLFCWSDCPLSSTESKYNTLFHGPQHLLNWCMHAHALLQAKLHPMWVMHPWLAQLKLLTLASLGSSIIITDQTSMLILLRHTAHHLYSLIQYLTHSCHNQSLICQVDSILMLFFKINHYFIERNALIWCSIVIYGIYWYFLLALETNLGGNNLVGCIKSDVNTMKSCAFQQNRIRA